MTDNLVSKHCVSGDHCAKLGSDQVASCISIAMLNDLLTNYRTVRHSPISTAYDTEYMNQKLPYNYLVQFNYNSTLSLRIFTLRPSASTGMYGAKKSCAQLTSLSVVPHSCNCRPSCEKTLPAVSNNSIFPTSMPKHERLPLENGTK